MAGFAPLKQLAATVPGETIVLPGSASSVPGSEISLLTLPFVVGKLATLYLVTINNRFDGIFKVYNGAQLIGGGYTYASDQNPSFSWASGLPIGSSDVVVTFSASSWVPVTDVTAYLEYTLQSI